FDQGRDVALGLVDSPTTAAVFAVIVIFLVTFAAGKLLAAALGSRVKNSIIGPLDRVLGFGFGALKGLLLAVLAWMLLTLVFDVVPGDDPEWLDASRSGPLLDILGHEVSDFVASRREDSAIGESDGYSEDERDAMDALFEQDLAE
ncbi:MAG: CvpA family protein, partial [Pacificimonas sp.]